MKDDLDEILDLSGLHIEEDDEYQDMDYYKSEGKNSDYNYIKRKYDPNYLKAGTYISLYRDNCSEKLGYYYLTAILSAGPIDRYSGYTIYGELLEFGFVNNNTDDIRFLLGHMLEYASECGMKFIKVKTKEKSFEKFYELLRTYPHRENEKHIYLELQETERERFAHLKHYDGDKLTLRELYHLYAAGFRILADRCVYQLPNNEKFVVERKNRIVSYPERFIHLGKRHQIFSQDAMDLMNLYAMDAYDYRNKTVDVDYRIDGYDYAFIKIGKELLAFKDFKYKKGTHEVRDDFIDFVIKAHEEYGICVLHICTGAKLMLKQIYSGCSKERHYLPSIIEKHRKNT